MKKQAKRALGILGLGLVAGITAIAASMPSASALESGGDTDPKAASTEVKVTVVGTTPFVELSGVLDDSTISDSIPTFQTTFNNTKKVNYTLEYIDASGVSHTYTLPSYTPTDVNEYGYGSGTHDFTIDLSGYGGYGDYILRASLDDSTTFTDALSFTYAPISIDPSNPGTGGETGPDGEPETDDEGDEVTGNPVINIDPESGITKICVDVYDPVTGAKINHDTICADVDADGNAELDFGGAGIPKGDYDIVIDAYDGGGTQILDNYPSSVHYVPSTKNAPAVPNTGSIFAGLNFGQADYLVSGIVIFGLSALAAIFFLFRKKSSRK